MKENFKISENGKFITYTQSWNTNATIGDKALAISYGNRVNAKKLCNVIGTRKSGSFEIIEVRYDNGKIGELYGDEYTILSDEEVQYIKDFYNSTKNAPAIKNITKSGFKIKGKNLYLTQKIWRNQSKLDENRDVKVGDIFVPGVDAVRIQLKTMYKILSLRYETGTVQGSPFTWIYGTIENIKTGKVSEKIAPAGSAYRLQPGEFEEISEFYEGVHNV